MSTSRDTGSGTIEKLDPENTGIAVGILLLCAVELETIVGKIPPSHLPAHVAKNRCWDTGTSVKRILYCIVFISGVVYLFSNASTLCCFYNPFTAWKYNEIWTACRKSCHFCHSPISYLSCRHRIRWYIVRCRYSRKVHT